MTVCCELKTITTNFDYKKMKMKMKIQGKHLTLSLTTPCQVNTCIFPTPPRAYTVSVSNKKPILAFLLYKQCWYMHTGCMRPLTGDHITFAGDICDSESAQLQTSLFVSTFNEENSDSSQLSSGLLHMTSSLNSMCCCVLGELLTILFAY